MCPSAMNQYGSVFVFYIKLSSHVNGVHVCGHTQTIKTGPMVGTCDLSETIERHILIPLLHTLPTGRDHGYASGRLGVPAALTLFQR